MNWYKNLYVGENARVKQHKIIKGIKNNKFLPNTFLITLPVSEGNVLEMYPAAVMLQNHYKNIEMMVVGIAVGRDEGLKTIENIIMDCYNAMGNFDIAQFVKM